MLQEYFRRKNPELESKIVEKYLPYARMLAYNQAEKAGKLGDFDNIYGDAALGLLNAIRNYDPQEGVKFETYATYKIRGAILDGVRKNDWIPRTAHQKQKAVNEVREKLRIELGRVPFMEEIADALNMSLTHIWKKTEIPTFLPPLYQNFRIRKKRRRKRNWQKTGRNTGKLSERERLVIQLYYYEELSFIEIADVLGVSQPRVSQLHTRALGKMRPNMGKYMELFV